MAEPAQSQGQPFRIKIIEGPFDGRVIELDGRALPYRGVVYESEQREKTTYYTGNPVATQQILGPIDKPTTINGIWKDIFLGNGGARALVDIFDGLMRSGFSVEVSWGSNTVSSDPAFVRLGIIKRFKHTYDRPQDIGWEIEFAFRGRDEASASPFMVISSIREGFDEVKFKFENIRFLLEAFRDSNQAKIFGLPQFITDAIDDTEDALIGVIEFLDATSDAIQGNTDIPGNLIERARTLFDLGVASILNFAAALGAFATTDLTVKWISGDKAIEWLDTKMTLFEMAKTMDDAAETAINASTALARQQRPEIVAEVQPIAGTDLRELANTFYGDPELWWVIADYNNLSSSKVPELPDGPSDRSVESYTIKVPQRPQGIEGTVHPSC